MNYTLKHFNHLRGHVLFPQKLWKTIPDLYETKGHGYDAVAHFKVFHPLSNWYWYGVEFDGADVFYGLVFGHAVELGYFNRTELELGSVRRLPFERDLGFKPKTLREIIALHKKHEPDRLYPDV